MKTAAIIQARMKSTRMPGKVLMSVGGKPILWHIIQRLRRAQSIDEIAITTSDEREDDAIVKFAEANGVAVTRGPEHDMLARFEIAARALDPDNIVRVTGDSPLIDPWFVDFFVSNLNEGKADFVMIEDGVKCIQEGVDPFSRHALDVMLREARSDPVAREHLTAWLKMHPESVCVKRIHPPQAYEFSARLSVDTPSDLSLLDAIAQRIHLETASLVEVVSLLKREPWLMTINAHVRQKSAAQLAGTVLLHADGGGKLGLGHLMRMASLGEALRDREGLGVIALTGTHDDGDPVVAKAVFEAHKLPVIVKPAGKGEDVFIADEAVRTRARAIVLDVRTSLSRETVKKLHTKETVMITIDDISERRLAADLAVFPPIPQAEALDWSGFNGEVLIGAEYVVLAPGIARAVQERRTRISKAPRLLVTMGGSDPKHLTGIIAAACTRKLGDEMPIDVVIGPAVANADELVRWMNKLPGIVVHRSPNNVASLYAQATLAIVSFGVTAYELAALGVPALYVALTDDHRQSALAAEALGFGRYASMAVGLIAPRIAEEASRLLADGRELERMSNAGRAAIDGRGANRVAEKIASLIAAQGAQPAQPQRSETPRANRRVALGG